MIGAEMLQSLCTGTGSGAKWAVLDGVHLSGARVSGHLDLSGAELPHPLHFHDCVFEDPASLRQARIKYVVEWSGGKLSGIEPDRSESEADLIVQSAEVTGPALALADQISLAQGCGVPKRGIRQPFSREVHGLG